MRHNEIPLWWINRSKNLSLWRIGWGESTPCTRCLMAKSSLSLSSPSLLLCSHLSFFPISFSKDPSSLTSSPDCIATKTDLCSGHHKKATILGCGRREIKPHHKDSIVSSPANSHKWDKYWCLFSRPPQGFASTWARYWSSPDLTVEYGNALITNQTKKKLKF